MAMARLAKVALMPFTLTAASDCVDLLVMGDYGTQDDRQLRIAAGLAAVATETDPVAIAAIGDNIYRSGADYNQWNVVEKWAKRYLQDDKLQSLRRPWHVITGNHDWYTDARIERDFTWSDLNKQWGEHWQMPGFWYKKTYKSSSGISVDAFYIDTVIWRGSWVVDSNLEGSPKTEQINWLRHELETSQADWKIVLGHHPVYSAGNHGMSTTLYNELDPMLREYGVPMYFAGHDHSKQIIAYEGMNYIISGAGGAVARERSNEYPYGSLKHYYPDGGFVGLQVCDKYSAMVTIYGESGQVEQTWPVQNAVVQPLPSAKFRVQWASAEAPVEPTKCNGAWLRSVEKYCSMDGCKVLADQIHTKSCADYCAAAGLACARSWAQQEDAQDCVAGPEVACDAGVKAESGLICECTSKSEEPVLLP